MFIDLTEKELCLVVQSVESTDWTYCNEDATAKSVIRKCKKVAAQIVQAQEKNKEEKTPKAKKGVKPKNFNELW